MSNNVKKKDWEYPKLKTSILLDTRVREHLDEENRLTNIPVSRIINSWCLEKMRMSGVVICKHSNNIKKKLVENHLMRV